MDEISLSFENKNFKKLNYKILTQKMTGKSYKIFSLFETGHNVKLDIYGKFEMYLSSTKNTPLPVKH